MWSHDMTHSDSQAPLHRRPTGVTFIAVINGIAFLLTLLFWGTVAFSNAVPFPSGVEGIPDRANAATTWGFLIGDVAFSAPLLLLATIGLWKPRAWGWTAAQMTNILWIYSMTIIILRDAFTSFSPGGILFMPFVPVAVWSIFYLWRHRDLFWSESRQHA
jgi:hypothetical protein